MFFQSRSLRIVASVATSVFLWCTVKLVNTYTTTIEIPVRYKNIPVTYKITHPLPERFRLTVSGLGHELVLPSLEWDSDSATLDLGPIISKSSIVSPETLLNAIQSSMRNQLKVLSVQPDTLKLFLEKKVHKKVPVHSQVKIVPVDGYLPILPPKLQPDSVILMGTKQELDKISHWSTQTMKVHSYEVNKEIPLRESSEITYEPQTLTLRMTVARCTEGTIRVPIYIENAPPNHDIRLIPNFVEVSYSMPLQDFRELTAADFRVSVNMRQPDGPANALIPYLEKKTIGVVQYRIRPPTIRYVLTDSVP